LEKGNFHQKLDLRASGKVKKEKREEAGEEIPEGTESR